jgi:hypothetical protein
MHSKKEKLNELFQRWRQSNEKYTDNFSEDGIVEEGTWLKTSPKVLFLLKETYDYRDNLIELITKYNYWKKPWTNVGCWAYGLIESEQDHFPPFKVASESEKSFSAFKSSAIMNLKKSTGGNRADVEKIIETVQNDKNFIKEELDIIQPGIVVCGATFEIAKKIISELNSKPIDDDGKCYKIGETLWIDYCHPSAYYRHDMMYYTLIALYQNYLRITKQ